MDWFYALNGQQHGPVPDTQLETLLRAGTITQETLVWRQGMADWTSLQTARGTRPPPPPLMAGGTHAYCVECGLVFSQGDMLFLNQSWVCAGCKPIFLQRLREGSAPAGGAIWRSNKQMVMRPETPLPDKCVCCNAPANGYRLKRTLHWHPPIYYVLVLISLLIYIIVALCVRKKAVIYIGLCETHRLRRKWIIIGSWVGLLAGVAMIIASIAAESGAMAGIGTILFLGAILFGAIKGPVVSAAKIDKDFVWVKGARREFLDQLPEWNQPL